ncbi:MAG: chemotaxis protein CheW [Magnetococcales bacterium]|nr:chemotaxis protein CheW [Magnetococcales bacterium]MBF0114931.1 chemotaxis protein CheW [Magnetococcales bacterium]
MSEPVSQIYPEILAQAAELRQRDALINIDEEQVQLLIFRLLEHTFAIPGAHVRELLPAGEIVPVPGSSPLFLGVIPVRGEIASVLDLARLLQLPPGTSATAHNRSSRILIVQKEEMSTGMLVDAVEEIREFPKSAVQTQQASLNTLLEKLSQGQLLFNHQPTPLLDIAKLFQYLQELCA